MTPDEIASALNERAYAEGIVGYDRNGREYLAVSERQWLSDVIRAAIAEEREACAALAASCWDRNISQDHFAPQCCGDGLAAAIRARGEGA